MLVIVVLRLAGWLAACLPACLPAYVLAWTLVCLHPACLRVDVTLNYNANHDIVVRRQQCVLTTEFSIVFQAT